MANSINPTITTLGSHSALEVCRGAKDEGFATLVVCQKGREKTYKKYYKTDKGLGCIDECIILDTFSDILKPDIQKELNKKNSIFIPNRSFEVYVNDYNAIEQNFSIPMFGNKKLLRIEERGFKPNQYDLLQAANIRYPKIFKDPHDIDRLCIVKVQEKERGFERAFFLIEDYSNFKLEVEKRLSAGVFTEEQIEKAVIEEFVVGVQVNFNYFYSPLHERLELLGTDTRRQTNIEGLTRLPSVAQNEVLKKVQLKYEESGHIAVTVLESMLEKAFELGERFIEASKNFVSPGVIGPFALQSIIIPGPPKKDIVVIDVSPRFPGSPGISSTPYSGYLFGKPVTVGQRIAMEIKEAIQLNRLDEIVT
jgi:5-formaminoimidazole-4-carboxamide-1-(beta)-D-ribofuranosyl 5'-monophosphate synthetase